jgi:hypothetical protein
MLFSVPVDCVDSRTGIVSINHAGLMAKMQRDCRKQAMTLV